MESPLRTLTHKESEQKRQSGADYITEVFEPSFGCPIPSKHGHRPQAAPWRTVIHRKPSGWRIPLDWPRLSLYEQQCPLLRTLEASGRSRYQRADPWVGVRICMNCPLSGCIFDDKESDMVPIGYQYGTDRVPAWLPKKKSHKRLEQEAEQKLCF